MTDKYNVGDKVMVIERWLPEEEEEIRIWESEGEIVKVTDVYVETCHRKDANKYPECLKFTRSTAKVWTKHYFHPNGKLKNIRLL